MIIAENKIKCNKCGDIIESTNRHDYKMCSRGSVGVDGGHDYLRRIGDKENFTELSNILKNEDIYELPF